MHLITMAINIPLLSAPLKRIPTNMLRAAMSTSIKTMKLEYFEEHMKDGWDPNGTFKCLHLYMPHRQGFIMDELRRKGVLKAGNWPLEGLKVLDVGCGHGLMTETMAAFGADVVGIDPADKLVQIAKEHAHVHSPSLLPQLRYYTSTAEEHVVGNTEQYDVIMAFFILEHVTDPSQFLNNCLRMLKKDGSIFIQHVNKTWKCLLLYMLWQMHVTGMVPKGVTSYSHLSSTNNIVSHFKSSGCGRVKTQGIKPKVQGDGFYLTVSPDYINVIHAVKTG